MSKLSELLNAVKDENLSLQQVEKYRDEMVHLKMELHRQRAELKKKRALFMFESKEKSVSAKKLAFEASPEGQTLMTIEGYLGGITSEIDSLQSRVYGLLRKGEV